MITLYLWPDQYNSLDFWFVDENNTLLTSGNEQLYTGMMITFSSALTISEMVDKLNAQTSMLTLIQSIRRKFPDYPVQAIVWADYGAVKLTLEKKKEELSSLSLEDLKGIIPGLRKLAE